MTWLDDIVFQHEEFEAPLSFWKWSALAAVSATIKDQIWLDNWIYNLYPNIYVMLHADSGLKKGPPISMAHKMVSEVNNTRIIRGRASIQGILKKLGEAQTQPGGVIMNKAVAFICSSELTSSIVSDPVANDILTDLYDRNYNFGDWESLLKVENFKLKDPCITMLTATNEAHSSDFFTRKDTQGGYIARTFIIHESKRNVINSLAAPPKFIPDHKKYADYLRELAKLKGPMEPLGSLTQSDVYKYPIIVKDETKWLSEVGKIYDEWYNQFIHTIDDSETRDTTGTLNRFGDSVLKVAILLSLTKKPELRIDTDSMREAIVECEKLIGNVRKATLGRGKHILAEEKGVLIEELVRRDNHIMSREQLNKKYWMRASADEWDDVARSLEVAGILRIESIGNQIIYRMPPNVYAQWENHLKGK